jgi:chromosome segregation protein
VLQDQSEQLKLRIDALEAQQRSEAVDAARAVAFGLERVQERLRGLFSLAGQRLALLEDDGTLGIEVATVSQAAIDEARAEIDEISAGLGGAQDAAEAARAT